MTAINVKYLGEYRTEKLARVKAMRFYLGCINHLGSLRKKSARLVRQAHQPVRQAGFTITEVLLASSMMLIVISVAGIGVINLLRSNYRANADSEIQNNLNRTLEFVSDEVRRARIIAETQAAIMTDQVPEGARAVLAFRIPDPSSPGLLLPNQIVYYTKGPENSLTGPRVLWRYGPNLDANGNYITPADVATWQHSPVTDMLAAAANNPNCPTSFTRIPVLGNVDDFYTCVRAGGNQVILNAKAQVEMTTVTNGNRDKVDYSVSTRVATRATNEIFVLESPSGSTNPTLPIVTMPANVTAKVIQGNCASCTVAAGRLNNIPPGVAIPSTDQGTTIQGISGDAIVVAVNPTLTNRSSTPPDQVDVYTSDSSDSPRNLDNNQVLFVFTSPPNSYQVLVTITPR